MIWRIFYRTVECVKGWMGLHATCQTTINRGTYFLCYSQTEQENFQTVEDLGREQKRVSKSTFSIAGRLAHL